MKLRDIISEGSQMSGSMAARKKKLDMMTPDEIRAVFKNREDVAKQARGGQIAPGFSAKELAQRQEFSYGREFAKGRPYSKHFESTQKPYVSQAADGQWNVLDKDGKTVFSSGNYNVAQDYFKKNYDNLKEIELDEGLKDWLQRMAVAGIIVGSVAGIGSINNAINNNVPVIQAMNKALDVANQKGDTQLIQNIKQDIEVARLSLDSGRDLNTVKNMQDRYAKFMPADYKKENLSFKDKIAKKIVQPVKDYNSDNELIMVINPNDKQGIIKIPQKSWPDYEKKGYVQAESNESYGRYWCSTDKKFKQRQSPKQDRS